MTTSQTETSQEVRSQKVWDWTIRVFHWSTVALVAAMWWTAENGKMQLHLQLGQILVGVFVYRIYWGIFGSYTARFTSFVKGPGAMFSYLKKMFSGPYKPGLGHNPVGALSVIALLIALAVQLTAGLFAIDVNGLDSGPLSRHVDYDTGRWFADLHESTFNFLLALIILHVVAVTVYLIFFKTNLVRPMITGSRKSPAAEAETAPAVKASAIKVVIGIVISVAVVYLIGAV